MRLLTAKANAGALMWLVTMLLLPVASLHASDDAFNLLVLDVTPHYGADRGGIRAGDILSGWSPSDSGRDPDDPKHAFASAMDVFELEREQHPVIGIMLHGLRDGQPFVITPSHGRWRLNVRPVWPDSIDVLYQELSDELENGDVDKGIELALELAGSLRERGRDLDSAWLLWRAGAAASANRQFDRATDIYKVAVDSLDANENPREVALYKSIYGRSLMNGNRLEESSAALQDANDAERAISPDRLTIARNLMLQSLISKRNGDLEETARLLNEGLWLQERVAPKSYSAAQTLNQLGIAAVRAGNSTRAEDYFSRALAISEQLDPGGVSSGGYLNSLAMAHYFQGDLSGAEEYLGRSAEIKLRLEPGTNNAATALHNLGLMKLERGFFRDAETHYLQSLAIVEQIEPVSLAAAATLNNLGSLALDQGDIAQAASYHQRSLKIKRELAPNSTDLAATLINLGNVFRQQGKLDEAEQSCQEGQQLQQKIAAGTQRHATAWLCLGAIAEAKEDIALAVDRYEQGLTIHRALAANGAGVAEAATRLGGLALQRKQHDAAEDYFEEAHRIVSRIAPGTFRAARALHGLAEIEWARDNTDAAVIRFTEAIDALDAQDALMSSTEESRANVRAKHQRIYKRFIELLVELGQEERAFDILERSRAKVLRELLAERELVFDSDVPEELERERRILAHNYEKKQAELYDATDDTLVNELREELSQIRLDRADAERRIRAQSPGLANFDQPPVMTFQSARVSMRAGTAVLSFNVMDDSTHLFVISSSGELSVLTVAAGKAEIADITNRLRLLIDAGRWDRVPAEPLEKLSATAYDLLLGPAEKSLADAQRLLVLPDASLRLMPFSALRRINDRGESEYVAQWKPLVVTDSLAVQSHLGDNASPAEGNSIVAFGNPDYSGAIRGLQDEAALRNSGGGSRPLTALPWSKEEVESIRQSYPGTTLAYFGEAATEERAKAISGDARYVHFATHTVLDRTQPMDTAIVLSVTGQDSEGSENGYLQAWEVIETLRLNADLVVLSGCETALGTEFPGEGLIGLKRAFHYAGAASVMASLWRVDDRSTSQLMTAFYQNLAEHRNPGDALQLAQVAMINGQVRESRGIWASLRGWIAGDAGGSLYAHPYHWAAFAVDGKGD